MASAPGRLEILGNHTDYNQGYVLSGAVSQRTEFAMRAVKGSICRIVSEMDGNVRILDLDKLRAGGGKKDWTTYVVGVICEIRKRGGEVGAFDAAVSSDVPLSAGMSSSAALEMSAGFAFREAFGLKFPLTDWARIGQGAENNFVGVKSGLLDQFSSIFGRKNSLILCDFRKVEVLKTVPLPEGYAIVVANSMVKHDLVDSDYNLRFESCRRALDSLRKKYPDISALRDVDMKMLEAAREHLDHQDFLRARHIVGEDERVMEAVRLLGEGKAADFGRLLYESHESSRCNFENSCPELDYLVELAKSLPGCIGARLSGGGFGGISIHFVEEKEAEAYSRRLRTAFKLRTGKETETVICSLGDGAGCERVNG